MDSEAHQERFRALYEEHRARVLAYCVRRTEIDNAVDLLAETFTVAWQRIDDVPSGDASLYWLYAVARRLLANHHRRERHRTEVVSRMGVELACGMQAESDDSSSLEARTALDRLSDDEREILMLAGWEGLSSSGIAMTLGCSTTAARIRLHRARARLTAELNEICRFTKQPNDSRHSIDHKPLSVRPTEEA